MIRQPILLTLLTLATAASTAQHIQKFAGLRLYTENDFLTPIGNNTDDNYTGGVKIEVLTNLGSAFFAKRFVNPMQWTPVLQSLSFTVTAFTPNDLGNPSINYNERPYASYQAWNIGAAFTKDNQRLSYELSLGVMGKDLAGDAQKKIHREHWFNTSRPIPQGWQYQVGQGGAFAANLGIKYETLVLGKASTDAFQWIAGSWMHEMNLGQYLVNYAQGLRLYFLNYHHPLPYDEEAPVIAGVAPGAPKKKFSFFCFVTPRVKAVAYNGTLTGGLLTTHSPYTLPASDVINAVLEYDAGAVLRFHFVRLGYNLFGRSREYKNEVKSFHHWGGIYLGFVASFK